MKSCIERTTTRTEEALEIKTTKPEDTFSSNTPVKTEDNKLLLGVIKVGV